MDFPELEWNHVGPGKPNKKANGVLVMESWIVMDSWSY